ncbi:MAG: PDZ domain-containing protein [Dehalococcoidia bacterium]|nr:PDZ domain-containing protein [Dehalococcoidia bacterium]
MRHSRRVERLRFGMLAALLALSVLAGCVPVVPYTAAPSAETPPAPATSTYIPVSQPAATELRSVADVVARVKPAVVAISSEVTTYDLLSRPWTQQSAGSGWIIKEDGYIVTNNHVVEGATSVIVTLDDGRSFEAEGVYTDELTDLAVVKIPVSGLPVAEIGDSAALRIGDPLVAIGNSLGMGISATSGIVSAVGISLASSPGQTLLELVQTDAAINPGNSGGPLVNASGQVVGINSVKIAQIGVEGMGYSITMEQALPVIRDLIDNGRVVRPWFGVGLITVSPVISSRYGLGVDSGVMVTEVVSGSPADKIGLQAGDVITVFGARNMASTHDFIRAINGLAVGNQVEVIYWRGEEKLSAITELAASPAPQG